MYYKVGQAFLQKVASRYYKAGQVIYHKVGQSLLQSGAGVRKWSNFVMRWGRY